MQPSTDEALETLAREHGRDVISQAVERAGQTLGQWLARAGSEIRPSASTRPAEARVSDPHQTPEQLAHAIATQTGLREGLALELIEMLAQDVTASNPGDALMEARARMPKPWAELFQRSPSEAAPPATTTHTDVAVDDASEHPTLSSGWVGSTRPLSTSAPGAQRRSIASDDDPRADSKLSSAGGTHLDQVGDSLERGRPASRHPLSEGREG